MTQQLLNFDAAEKKRRDSNKTRVLERLRKGPATNMQLYEVGGVGYGRRVHELRGEGFRIDVSKVQGGLFMYELVEGR